MSETFEQAVEQIRDLPYIDERVDHVGITRLRAFNATNLRQLDKIFVIQDGDKPLAVLLPYKLFLSMQRIIIDAAMRESGEPHV